jgi:hypothetical protein
MSSHLTQRVAAVALVVMATVLAMISGMCTAGAQTKAPTAASVVSAINHTYAVCTRTTAKAGSDGSKSTTGLGINDCSVTRMSWSTMS